MGGSSEGAEAEAAPGSMRPAPARPRGTAPAVERRLRLGLLPRGQRHLCRPARSTGPRGSFTASRTPPAQRRKPRAREVGVVARRGHSTSMQARGQSRVYPLAPQPPGKQPRTDDPTAPRSRHPDPGLGPCRVIFRRRRELLTLPFRRKHRFTLQGSSLPGKPLTS